MNESAAQLAARLEQVLYNAEARMRELRKQLGEVIAYHGDRCSICEKGRELLEREAQHAS